MFKRLKLAYNDENMDTCQKSSYMQFKSLLQRLDIPGFQFLCTTLNKMYNRTKIAGGTYVH